MGSPTEAAALEGVMGRRHLIMLLALAAIWGSSFMFIEIALRDLEPSTLILLRMASGAARARRLHRRHRPPPLARCGPCSGRSPCSASRTRPCRSS